MNLTEARDILDKFRFSPESVWCEHNQRPSKIDLAAVSDELPENTAVRDVPCTRCDFYRGQGNPVVEIKIAPNNPEISGKRGSHLMVSCRPLSP
jgi:hypothetical protein